MRKLTAVLTVTATVLAAGCATVPAPLAGTSFAAVTPQQAITQNAAGQHVRWGGEILKVEPRENTTCFEILARELSTDARPETHDRSDGRFIACKQGFYDPAIYVKGRDITVVGALNGAERHKVGEYDYTFAKVDADEVYMWPKRVEIQYPPYLGTCGFGWHPGWGCGWGGVGYWR